MVAAAGCSTGTPLEGVLRDLVEHEGLFSWVAPPYNSGCGRVQPGYMPGDSSVDPPIPPTMPGTGDSCGSDDDCASEPGEICRDGRCRALYDVFADAFCSVSWTRGFSVESDVSYQDDWAYVIDMGEPGLPLPPHLEAIYPVARESGSYCHFRWRVEAEPVGDYAEREVVLLRRTLVDVSHFCSRAYVPAGFCAEGDAPPEGCVDEMRAPIVDTQLSYVFASSDPSIMLLLFDGDVPFQGEDLRFQGFEGMPETSGWTPGRPGGFTNFLLPCESPEPSSDGIGPGFCRTCRWFSDTNRIDRCDWWEHVRALPASPALIHPNWTAAHPDIFDEIHGSP